MTCAPALMSPVPRMWRAARLPLGVCLLLAGLGPSTGLWAAPAFRAQVAWEGGVPQLKVTLDPGAPLAAEQTVFVGVAAVNKLAYPAEGFSGGFPLKVAADGKPVTVTQPLVSNAKWGGSNDLDYVRVSVRDDILGLACDEYVYPIKAEAPLQSYSVRVNGGFGKRTAVLALHLAPQKLAQDQAASLDARLLDGAANQLLGRTAEIALDDSRAVEFETDVTPAANATGPYTVAFSLNNEVVSLAEQREARFALAALLVPVSGMESDALVDWHLPSRTSLSGSMAEYLRPKNPLDPLSLPATLYSSYQPFTRPAYDGEVRHSGLRSLKITYTQGAPVVVGSNLRLPGLPVVARLWVKGNNTRDTLELEWRDPCNFNAAA